MNDRQATTQGSGVTLGDIYYVLFRHKWKIILCSAAGMLAAVALYLVKPHPYQSEAKLFIRYVLEAKSLSPDGEDSRVRSTDPGGANIINSEIEILTSLDLAQQVVDTIGPEKILAKAGGGRDRIKAAALVQGNLIVEVPTRSSVIRIVFQHPDPEVVQPVLSRLIDSYLKKHAEVHGAAGVSDDFLTQETDQLRSRLAQTEQELRKARNKAGVISLDDTKKAYTEQISKIREALFDAEADLAERQAALKGIAGLLPGSSETPTVIPELPAGEVDKYKSIYARLDLLRKREQELLTQFTEQSTRVTEVREQIAEAEVIKHEMEKGHPQLARISIFTPKPTDQRAGSSVDLSTEAARTMALESRIKVLNSQLDQIRTEAASVDEMEASILELQRKKQLEEANYRYFSASLEQARIDAALGAGRVTNIGRIQEPSPPSKAPSKSLKMVATVAIGGVLCGLAWAFLIELYLDRSVKRPTEFETKLGLPLFLSIPDISRNGYRRLAHAAKPEPMLLKNGEGDAPPVAKNGTSEENGRHQLETWSHHHSLRPFYEALRDRLIVYFEVRNLTHKPKLIAVTGLGKGSGVSTTAAGLAACLSETGDGNVLLVDMNLERGAACQFYKGKPVCGLDEALYTKDEALVQDKLYVVVEGSNGDKLPRALPKRFSQLVPKLKASDYDYIIFDMPPISQTSVTPRLAGFMDMVLLVIESEKTNRDIVQQAHALLGESKANVCAVLNKTRTYVPQRLHQEFLSDA
jgi:uncharacterized protein involved in exopolysaccharide biosynthesis/Mrp family chromosome partitioning ATPase